MRHSFASLLSDSGVPIEAIARLVGHVGGSDATETIDRKQIRPVLLDGAGVMDRIFRPNPSAAGAASRNRTDDLFITRTIPVLRRLASS
jgi:hypothetical protein